MIWSTSPSKRFRRSSNTMLPKIFFTSSSKRSSSTALKIKRKWWPSSKPTTNFSLNISKAESFCIENSLTTLSLRNGQGPWSRALIPFSRCKILNFLENSSNIKKLKRDVFSKMPNISILRFQMEIKSTTTLFSGISLRIFRKYRIWNASWIDLTTKRGSSTCRTKESTKCWSRVCRQSWSWAAATTFLCSRWWSTSRTFPWQRTTL